MSLFAMKHDCPTCTCAADPAQAPALVRVDAERVAFLMWKAEADRAAPNVGKNRTQEGFADEAPETRDRWLSLARPVLAALEATDADQTNVQKTHIAPDAGVVVELVEAAKAMRHAVCGPTGFAGLVRHNSGLALPWPSLDAAEERLVRALALISHNTTEG